ncbi:cytochrome c oxidase assembly protein [Micromonospora sp. NPDC004551]|uniref:cytochrome c oxidase assembly protein n=1 Tax=Micromonospora sp. NPDC004551 TaxID=3154284 RepID=UPI0033A03F1A
MLAPLALVLGAPGTLALRTVDRRVGRAALRLLRHPVLRVLAHPVTGLLLTAGGLWLLYLTPLYRATLNQPALHALVLLHFVLSGYLFAWSIAGPDPGPHRPRVPVRLVVLGAGVAAHAVPAQLLYAGVLVDVPVTGDELRAGATVMYYGGRPGRDPARPRPARHLAGGAGAPAGPGQGLSRAAISLAISSGVRPSVSTVAVATSA